jgi:hypothetical protein
MAQFFTKKIFFTPAAIEGYFLQKKNRCNFKQKLALIFTPIFAA